MKKNASTKATPIIYAIKGGTGLVDWPDNQESPPRPNPLVEEAISHFFPNVGGDAPDWAKKAAKLAFTSAMPQKRNRHASKFYGEGFRCGELSGAVEFIFDGVVELHPPDPMVMTHWYGIRRHKEQAASLPPDQAKDFFAGMSDGEQRMREMPDRANAAQRAKAFRAIASDWREVKKFESTSQLHNWLLKKGVIVSGTDSRETRKVCTLIGLKFQNQWQKPKA